MSRFDFDWKPETIDANTIDLSQYKIECIPKKDIPHLDDICKICIYKQVEKYKDYLDEEGEPIGNRFIVDCKGILKDPVPAEVKQMLKSNPEIYAQAEGIYDPAKWAGNNMLMPDGRKWIPRWYQETMIKCLHEDSNIFMGDGTVKKIKNISIGDKVVSFNLNRSSFSKTHKVLNVFYNGYKDLYKVTLKNGDELKVTANHPLLAYKSFERSYLSIDKGLTPGIEVLTYDRSNDSPRVVIKKIEYIGKGPVYDIEVDFNHNFVADGIVVHNCTALRKVSRLGRRCLHYKTKIYTHNAGTKEIQYIQPGDIVSAYDVKTDSIVPSKVVYVFNNGIHPTYRLYDQDSISTICTLDHKWLTTAGVVTTEHLLDRRIPMKCFKYGYEWWLPTDVRFNGMQLCYDIQIEHEDHLFLTEDALYSSNSGKSDSLAVFSTYMCMTQPFLATNPDTDELLLDKDGNTFQRPTGVLIVTPRQTHADNIMGKITDFIKDQEDLKNSVMNFRKSPYYVLEFHNGSTITCLTTGAGTSSSGVSVRSFDADIILLDEANYLSDADVKAIMAILATNSSCQLWAVSTPKGIQDFFWNWCNAEATYKEFHYPTMVIPHWNRIKRQIMADVQTEDEFLHEWMAEFSAATEGVFRLDLVMDAAHTYKYEECEPDPETNVYSIGIDWNSTAGTEIVVVGFNTDTRIYQVVEVCNISKAQWTQIAAMEMTLELGKKWNPRFIYIDAGYGAVQEELFRLLSERAKHKDPHSFTARLGDLLFSYNFSQKIEIRDPITGKKTKKAAKPFLVENTVRRFEEKRLVFPRFDTLLHAQLANYVVASITTTGVPIYKPSKPSVGDHRLDALMLALIGYKLRLSDFAEDNGQLASLGFAPREGYGGKDNHLKGKHKEEGTGYQYGKKRTLSDEPSRDRIVPETFDTTIISDDKIFTDEQGAELINTLFGIAKKSKDKSPQQRSVKPVKPILRRV